MKNSPRLKIPMEGSISIVWKDGKREEMRIVELGITDERVNVRKVNMQIKSFPTKAIRWFRIYADMGEMEDIGKSVGVKETILSEDQLMDTYNRIIKTKKS